MRSEAGRDVKIGDQAEGMGRDAGIMVAGGECNARSSNAKCEAASR